MRYRDQPTIEVTKRVRCDVATAWRYVTDINLPARCSAELQSVEWVDDADCLTCSSESEDSHGGLRRWWGASRFIAHRRNGLRSYIDSTGTTFVVPPTCVGGV